MPGKQGFRCEHVIWAQLDPSVPEGHWHLFGLTHVPPFTHGGEQIGVLQPGPV